MDFILFNGPPGAGKDTAGMYTQWHLWGQYGKGGRPPIWERLSSPGKMAFAAMTHSTMDGWFNVDGYEATKDEVIPWLGISFRQWQIDYSERFMKPAYGPDIYGKLLLVRCWEHIRRQAELHATDREPIFIVADCGFQVELDTLAGHNILLLTIERPDCTFEGDSREWVKAGEGQRSYHIRNLGTKRDLRDRVEWIVDRWLENDHEANPPPG
jgi:hypothetical protein